jgi:hypothetical protein
MEETVEETLAEAAPAEEAAEDASA